jgi:HSP20 family molecular chaperone IbpA
MFVVCSAIDSSAFGYTDVSNLFSFDTSDSWFDHWVGHHPGHIIHDKKGGLSEWTLQDTKQAVAVSVPISGFVQNEIQVFIQDHILHVNARRSLDAVRGPASSYHHHHTFSESMLIPGAIDVGNAHAIMDCRRDLLDIRIPKLLSGVPSVRRTNIKVETAPSCSQ